MGLKWKRKLQGISEYSRYVALPKLWIISNNLEERGETVLIEWKGDGSLVITPETRKPIRPYEPESNHESGVIEDERQ